MVLLPTSPSCSHSRMRHDLSFHVNPAVLIILIFFFLYVSTTRRRVRGLAASRADVCLLDSGHSHQLLQLSHVSGNLILFYFLLSSKSGKNWKIRSQTFESKTEENLKMNFRHFLVSCFYKLSRLSFIFGKLRIWFYFKNIICKPAETNQWFLGAID